MSIGTASRLMVGCSYGELAEFFKQIIEEGETDEHGACDNAGEVIECYFDYASPEDWFIGYDIPTNCAPDEKWFNKVHEEAKKFEALTGVKARICGGRHA